MRVIFLFFLLSSLLISNSYGNHNLQESCLAQKFIKEGLKIRKSDPKKALNSFLKGFNEAISCGSKEKIILSRIYGAETLLLLNQFDSAIFLLNKNKDLLIADPSQILFSKNNLTLGVTYYYKNQLIKAEQTLKMVMDAESIRDSLMFAKVLNNLGLVKYAEYQYDSALYYFIRGFEIKKQLGEESKLSTTASNIGSVLKKVERYDEAISYLNEAMHYDSLDENYIGVAQCLNNIAAVYIESKKPDLAIPILLNASSMFKNYGYARGFASTQYNLGKLYYENQSNVSLSEGFYLSAAEIYDTLNSPANLFSSYLSLAELKIQSGNNQEAQKYLDWARGNLNNVDSNRVELEKYYFLKSELNKGNSNYKKAYQFLQLSNKAEAKRRLNEQKNRVNEIAEEQKYLLAIQKLQIANKEEELKIISNRIALISISFLFISLAFGIVYYSQRKKRKKAEVNYNIEFNRAKENSLKILELEKQNLTNQLAQKQENLLSQRSLLLEKNKILVDFGNEIEKYLNQEKEGDNNFIKGIREKLTQYQKRLNFDSEKWYKSYLEDTAWNEFIQNLQDKAEKLTVNEKRLAILLRSDFNSKEIAIAMGVAPKTIDMNRYRLRKKLGLEKGKNLVEYLKAL
ncbi:tetratricopeptide repeat protein [Mangrovivirga cuniculi]|uniref:HTH luxR-type domain-containing protein n=1 Tax=Mangrovivirga cuniculi TaxID=2715131 RepID=A0A4D7JQU2_9BACT|nr:tetratricopeptide repeat protein [Mangrovivirga cuniculi]QCK15142.1 hypothetical protein DCC35_10490 [Mangrovivirga cuniculi]